MKIRRKMDELLVKLKTRLDMAAEALPAQPGSGVVELVLIIVVLISLVLIFKGQLTSLIRTIFSQIDSTATSVF